MAELPSSTNYMPDEVTYGFVADRIILSVGDTRYDGDRFPDGVPANGVVRFIPARTQFYTSEEPATILPQEIRCTIYNRDHPIAIEAGYDSNLAGKLVDPAGHVGNVALVVGRYHVTYQLDTGQPHRVTIDVKPTHTNENPLWIPEEAELKPIPQERFVVNERVYKETLEARDEVLGVYDTVLLPVQVQDTPPENTDVIWVNPDEPAGTASDYALRAEAAAATLGDVGGLHVDNSVGTRVFVGDTIIYGDTGRRDISDLLLEGWAVVANGLSIRRENNNVTVSIDISRTEAGSSFANIFDPPPGFRVAVRARIIPAYITSTKQGWIDGLAGTIRIRDLSTAFVSGDRLTMVVSWSTNDPWPTSLPGTPA